MEVGGFFFKTMPSPAACQRPGRGLRGLQMFTLGGPLGHPWVGCCWALSGLSYGHFVALMGLPLVNLGPP